MFFDRFDCKQILRGKVSFSLGGLYSQKLKKQHQMHFLRSGFMARNQADMGGLVPNKYYILARACCPVFYPKQGLKRMKQNIKQSRITSIINVVKPNTMITLQLPPAYRSKNLDRFRFTVKNIMQQIEKDLLGKNWHKHHYPFVIFYENKNGLEAWHAHVLCNFTDRQTGETENHDDIEKAVCRANHTFRCSNGCKTDLDVDVSLLDNIKSVQDAVNYCQKEVWAEEKNTEYQIRFEFSEDLFSLKKHNAQASAL